MKKLIFIFLALFCLTGCDNSIEFDFNENIDAKVNLSFTLDEYKASLEEDLEDSEVESRIESMIAFRNAFTDPYSDLFEEKSFDTDGTNYTGVYEYTYTYSNFNDNSVLNNCFDFFGVQEDEDKLYIFANGESKCAPFKLIVKADDRMISSNENSRDGNLYIWDIQESNNDISMIISKTVINKTETEIKTKSSFISITDLIFLIIALIICIIVFIINKKYKESD